MKSLIHILFTLLAIALYTTPSVASGPDVISIAVGDYHVLALRDDGTVLSWGKNNRGQLGIGNGSGDQNTPVAVMLDNVKAISAGCSHSLGLKHDGTVWAWGSNDQGELGDGTTVDRYEPVRVNNLESIVAISAGNRISLALKSDGTVWAWGDNRRGMLGDGTLESKSCPIRVTGLNGIVSLGEMNTFALSDDGSVWAWGYNVFVDKGSEIIGGAAGDDSQTRFHTTPFKVTWLSDVESISSGASHILYLKKDGSVRAWGNNMYGQFGNGARSGWLEYTNSPVQVNVGYASAISTGAFSSVILKDDGSVWVCGKAPGSNVVDMAGGEGIPAPALVNGLNNIVGIGAGEEHIVALGNDGSLWAWGNNNYGQLGDGTTSSKSNPVKIISGHRTVNPPMTTITPSPTALSKTEIHSTGIPSMIPTMSNVRPTVTHSNNHDYESTLINPLTILVVTLLAIIGVIVVYMKFIWK